MKTRETEVKVGKKWSNGPEVLARRLCGKKHHPSTGFRSSAASGTFGRVGERFECRGSERVASFSSFTVTAVPSGPCERTRAPRVSSVKMLRASGLQDAAQRKRSLVVFSFRVCQNVWFEVGGLSKLFIAAVERANVGPVPGVNSDVRPEVKVQRETLPAALERTLDGEKDRTVRVSLGKWHQLHTKSKQLNRDGQEGDSEHDKHKHWERTKIW